MSFSTIILVYNPYLKTTAASFNRAKRPFKCYKNPTPASIARLNNAIVKSKVTIQPAFGGNIGWYAKFNERSL